jgi:hypothetical protein
VSTVALQSKIDSSKQALQAQLDSSKKKLQDIEVLDHMILTFNSTVL